MTTQGNPKVRLVRCPRCQQVLAELPDVPLYKCGGCGTVLEAKKQKVEANNRAESSPQETNTVAGSPQHDVLEEKETKSSNHDSTRPPSVESWTDKDNISCQGEHGDCIVEHSEQRDASNDISDGLEPACPQNEVLHTEAEESLKQSKPLGQDSRRYESKSCDGNGEWKDGSSSGLLSSGESTHEIESCASEASEHVEQHNKIHLLQDDNVEQVEGGEFQRVWVESGNFINGVQNLPELEDVESVLPSDSEHRDGSKHDFVLPENGEKSQISSDDQKGEYCEGIKLAGLNSCSRIVSHENGIMPQSGEQGAEVDYKAEGLAIFRRSSMEKNMNAGGHVPAVASQRSLNESLASFYLSCNEDEHLDHSPREVTHNFGRVGSLDTVGSSSFIDHSSEINFKYGSMTKYPPASSYYAYDGSESSFDGTDDQINEHIPSRKSKGVDYVSTTEMLRRDGFMVNNVVNSEPERNDWATSSSHRATRSSHWRLNKSTNGYNSENSLRLDKQERVAGLQLTSRDPLVDHGTRSSSSYWHNLLPPCPGFSMSDKASYLEPDKMELLRSVYELEDQLNRMQFPKVVTDRRFPPRVVNEKFSPYLHDHFAPEQELYADLNHYGAYNLRRDQAEGFAEQCSIPRLAFSGEALHYRHQASCSCLRCCPRDWHYSAQLPTQSMHCKNRCCTVLTDHKFMSSSTSPQQDTSSELSLWGYEMKSDNGRHDEIKRLRLKDKYHKAKKLLRPVAGGAPVVACYHCLELLQLPADFLLFKKRYHLLRCNACGKVLKFSLLEGTHIVPYIPDASAPPPSVADNYNKATRPRDHEPVSLSSSCQHVEAVSCSDYGQSFGRSCSTEGEASAILPSFDQAGRNSYNRKMSSGSSHEHMEDRKMKSILREHQNENGTRAIESVGPSSQIRKSRNKNSEMEEPHLLFNSPLHRLMGYSSVSQVLKN